MEQTAGQGITLGIESAIGGGSLSLFRGAVEIDSISGTGEISRAEELLPAINKFLNRSGSSPRQVQRVAVSTGPGSFTGIKIAIATARGLAAGLGCECFGVSTLTAMVLESPGDGEIITAVPVGRNFVCLQPFIKSGNHINALSGPELLTEDLFAERLNETDPTFVLHEQLCRLATPVSTHISSPRSCLASVINRACHEGLGSKDLTPVFIDRKPPAVLP